MLRLQDGFINEAGKWTGGKKHYKYMKDTCR